MCSCACFCNKEMWWHWNPLWWVMLPSFLIKCEIFMSNVRVILTRIILHSKRMNSVDRLFISHRHYMQRISLLPTESPLVFTHRPLQWLTLVRAYNKARTSIHIHRDVISVLLSLTLWGTSFLPLSVSVSLRLFCTPPHLCKFIHTYTDTPPTPFSRCEQIEGAFASFSCWNDWPGHWRGNIPHLILNLKLYYVRIK